MTPSRYIAVVGAGEADARQQAVAEEVGRLLAEAGATVVTGGLGGVMEAASKGAREARGTTVGLLPGADRREANEWLTVAIPTGIGEARNALVVRAADGVIAVGGAWGTLSEIAFARKTGKPVVGLGSWELEGVDRFETPAEAIAAVLHRLG
ncbi:MAG: TIGR00725 family protein [Thermoleophilaceae bacterium]